MLIPQTIRGAEGARYQLRWGSETTFDTSSQNCLEERMLLYVFHLWAKERNERKRRCWQWRKNEVLSESDQPPLENGLIIF